MKKYLCTLLAALSTYAGNLISNGNFSDGEKYWNTSDAISIDQEIFASAEDGNQQSLKITSEKDWTILTRKLYFAPNTDYDFSGWIKLENIQSAQIKISWSPVGNYYVDASYLFSKFPSTQDWKKYSTRFHVPSHAATGVLMLMVKAQDSHKGMSWFDELSITPVDMAAHSRGVDKYIFAEPFEHSANGMKPAGEPVVIKDWSKRNIVIPQISDAQCEYAAKVLSEMLGNIFSCKVAVLRDNQKTDAPFISLGNTKLSQAAGLSEHPQLQGYRITVKDGNLYLLGSRSGVLYSVLALLQEDFGCRFYIPSDPIKYPSVTSSEFAVVPRSYAPVFEIREPMNGQYFDNDIFNAFNRVQAISYFKSIPEYMGGGVSNSKYFIHTYDALVPAAKYFDSHPEYFPLRGGKRVASTQNMGQLCYTNPEVSELIASQLEQAIARNPSSHIYSVSQNDNRTSECECENCRAVKDGVPGAALLLANRVSERLAKTMPDIRITTLAYGNTQPVPKHITPSPNTVMFYAPISERAGSLGNLPWQDVPKIADELKGWNGISKRIYVWDYICSPDMMPTLDMLCHNIEFWIENKVAGVFIEDYEYGLNSLAPLRNWVLMQKLWNPNWSVDDLVEDFITGHYCEAMPEMREVVGLFRNRWNEFYKNRKPGKAFAFSKQDYAKLNELLAAAYSKNPCDELAGEIIACNKMQLKVCRKRDIEQYSQRLDSTIKLIAKHGLYLDCRRKYRHDKQLASWKENLEEARTGASFPIYSENSVIIKTPNYIFPCKGEKSDGAYLPEAGRVAKGQDWLIQWDFSKLLASVDNQSVMVARIHIKPELKANYPADKPICSLHLWRSGYPISATQGRFAKFSELKNNEWQHVDMFKVYMYSPSVAGYFYNCIGDLADGDTILYDLIEFIPLEDYKDKDMADKLPTIEL